jgi:hypothetical protein
MQACLTSFELSPQFLQPGHRMITHPRRLPQRDSLPDGFGAGGRVAIARVGTLGHLVDNPFNVLVMDEVLSPPNQSASYHRIAVSPHIPPQ